MNTSVPSYLRIHRGDESAARGVGIAASSTEQFWNAFSTATGWRIDQRHRESDSIEVLPAVGLDLMAGDPSEVHPPVIRENAAQLANWANTMAGELEQLRSTVRRQELELAGQATVQFAPSESQATADQVYVTLQRAITAMGFDAAAIYMLDDDTQYLKTRAVVGLPDDRLTAEPRMLRGSRGDLEALVQDAVLMEDLHGPMGDTWNAPESAGAAVCTALFKGDLPIGTLWLFSETPQQLDASVAAIAQMTSAQITLELSATAQSRRENRSRHAVKAIGDVAAWQYSALPADNLLAPGWFVDGMVESPHAWSIGWHHWDVLPDGSLMLAIAEAVDDHAGGAMVAATARAAMAAHCGYRHSPKQLLSRISDTLWQTNAADQLVSLMYIRLSPETGEGEVAVAGRVSGLIAGRYGYRPLVQDGGQPLANSFSPECFESTFHLLKGETLLAYGGGLQKDGISQELLGCCLRSASRRGENPLAMLRREIASFPNRFERGLVSLSRQDD